MAGELSLKTPLTGLVTLVPTNTATDKTITLPATTGTMVVQDGTNTTTVTNLAVTNVTASGTVNVGGGNISPQTGFKNRIINGAMTIDQRNAGAAVTTSGAYPIDRFIQSFSGGEVAISSQQDSSAPVGFVNSTKITITTAEVSVGADDRVAFQQRIEGSNVADLSWGTANAQTVTLSFWVRSSLTGTFGGVLRNSANDRSYPFTYSISAANTWEQKSVTIPGDTTGTWLTTTGIGIVVNFSLMAGTNFAGTAGSWAAAGYQGATGQVQLATTLNATWFITGVQLEKGSTATPFEFRSIGTELALCQRYYEKSYIQSTVPGVITAAGLRVHNMGSASITNSAGFFVGTTFCVTKRAAPSVTVYSYQGNTGRLTTAANISVELAVGTGTPAAISQNSFAVDNASGATATIVDDAIVYHFVAVSEL